MQQELGVEFVAGSRRMTMLEVNIARPDDSRVDWQVYIDGAIKVRQLNSGVVEYAVDDGDWTEAL